MDSDMQVIMFLASVGLKSDSMFGHVIASFQTSSEKLKSCLTKMHEESTWNRDKDERRVFRVFQSFNALEARHRIGKRGNPEQRGYSNCEEISHIAKYC